MMKNPSQSWIGRNCIEDAKSKNYNSRFLKVNFPKNKYFPETLTYSTINFTVVASATVLKILDLK